MYCAAISNHHNSGNKYRYQNHQQSPKIQKEQQQQINNEQNTSLTDPNFATKQHKKFKILPQQKQQKYRLKQKQFSQTCIANFHKIQTFRMSLPDKMAKTSRKFIHSNNLMNFQHKNGNTGHIPSQTYTIFPFSHGKSPIKHIKNQNLGQNHDEMSWDLFQKIYQTKHERASATQDTKVLLRKNSLFLLSSMYKKFKNRVSKNPCIGQISQLACIMKLGHQNNKKMKNSWNRVEKQKQYAQQIRTILKKQQNNIKKLEIKKKRNSKLNILLQPW